MTYFDVLVIGAGIAGTSFACGIVGRGFSGGLMVIGSEEGLPYKRTELSKRLVSPVLADSFTLPEFAELVGGPVEYRSGVRVLSIDVHDRTIQTSAGEFSYGILVL